MNCSHCKFNGTRGMECMLCNGGSHFSEADWVKNARKPDKYFYCQFVLNFVGLAAAFILFWIVLTATFVLVNGGAK